ncbi:ABC transporter permease [Zhaonella formicivorans]|uniref:ABC transporter permease n=1 Tax=Zhaonella formicivorans TaxID=2528593 RepID=UPI0010E2A938|nr:ABC transporter permease [Zhaonella formicivorans]
MQTRVRDALVEAFGLFLTIIISLGIGMVIILLTSEKPWEAFRILLVSPFSNLYNFGNVLERTVPFLFTGLAVAVAFRAQMFNIGAEGQLYMGALAGTVVAIYITGLPPVLHVSLALLTAMLAGGLFAAIPGYLKAYWDANEIVTTLMLNFVATLGVSYLINYPMKDVESGYSQTVFIQESAHLGRILPPSRAHVGLFLALATAVLLYYFLYKTPRGYQIRMVGLNPHFAEYGGINRQFNMVLAMVISGALAGLAGIVEILGIHWRLIDAFSPGYGFAGINIALLARNHPLAVPFAALFYAYLSAGAALMERGTDVSREVVSIVQAVLFFFITAEGLFAYLRRKAKKGGEPGVE